MTDKNKEKKQEKPDFKGITGFSGRIKKVLLTVKVYKQGFSETVFCKLDGEHWIKFKTCDGKKHKKMIGIEPLINERVSGSWIWKARRREIQFHVGYNAEATHDPSKASYNIASVENMIGTTKMICESDLFAVAAKPVSIQKKLIDLIMFALPWIGVVACVFVVNS